MKLSVSFLVLLGVLCIGSMVSAGIVHVTEHLLPGMNQICMQGVPINPDPIQVFSGIPIDSDVPLYRYDAATQTQYLYDVWAPWNFGNMLLGDGYMLYCAQPLDYSYDTLSDVDSMDVWISLPKAGWSLIGNPYSFEFDWNTVKVTDGNTTISLQDASQHGNNWMSSLGYWWKADEQSQYDIGLSEDWSNTTMMPVRHSIWVNSWIDKLALILEAPQS